MPLLFQKTNVEKGNDSLPAALKSGIYKITIGDYIYIGSSICAKRRYTDHLLNLKKQKHSNKFFQSVFNKYPDKITFEVLFYCGKDKLVDIEQYTLDYYFKTCPDNIMNIRRVAESNLGLKRTKEAIRKTNESNRGRKRSAEFCKNTSETRKGVRLSDNHRKNISKSKIGNKSALKHKITFLSPDGVEHYTENVYQFCLNYNLNTSKMYSVIKGKRRSHKGWTILKQET